MTGRNVHLEIKHALFTEFCSRDQLSIEEIEEVLAHICELELELLALGSDERQLAL
jgi:hypothetical protein